jgi:phosphohistidine phosphatase
MKQLYLLRHAKSSWKDTSLPDHDRPLSGRGRRPRRRSPATCARSASSRSSSCAPRRGARARRSSASSRALGTPAVRVERDLYAASAGALLERLRSIPDSVVSVMLIGHNPGLQELALDLARPSPTVHSIATKYPTAALATLAFPASNWQKLDHDTAELVELVRPRDLQ